MYFSELLSIIDVHDHSNLLGEDSSNAFVAYSERCRMFLDEIKKILKVSNRLYLHHKDIYIYICLKQVKTIHSKSKTNT